MNNSRRYRKKLTNKVLKRFYYSLDKSSAFTSAKNLTKVLQSAGYVATLKKVKQFLSTQYTSLLYRRALNKYARRQSTGALMKPGLCVFTDLWDMSKYSRENDGYKWLLVLIGMFGTVYRISSSLCPGAYTISLTSSGKGGGQ